ncbi:hypothetical protein C8R46DRAFT_1355639 [Mycena filopes]|nr:hypothetical protein C8R46DRAFT_1355639 [Mycena filopes]
MAQQPGTLVPGQSISVNKYTVQVERYLSQGGFAHVYLVRTATPVYNTTHHVLKRIAVANDAMLTEVKKEVDIMRLLKGHPNIVHLIDAAWHRMPNGLYEVFILMEFCPGGGIIDMMNRRLRERLTEAEILQIFVDVCEGVAYMHNSRPALLHRDLKVENILQSTATSFKLCDFGSATTVSPRPPATTQEIRALEADLNRHTTLQYRAPEMVDPYLRRAVDEKSDVWALGVLLYKLCYYTTPFEEHGPLAILNVQYRIPPYPVYSTQMNSLIASMLREHGNQRPSVFELLGLVHRLRGTKSQFTYTIPSPQPLSPRPQQNQFSQAANPLDATVTYRSQQPQPMQNAGVQARDKVLEAIAPMRRGRPPAERAATASPSRSRNASPQKDRERALPQPPVPQTIGPEKAKNWLEEEDKAWKAVTVKSGTSAPNKRSPMDDAWTTRGASSSNAPPAPSKGFGDDFAEKLWDSFDPNATTARAPAYLPPASKTVAPQSSPPPPLRQPAFTGSFLSRKEKDKDAFEGLGGLSAGDRPAPTLGEARLLRTGLAGMSSSSSHTNKYDGISGDYKDYKPSRPSPSPRLPAQALSPSALSGPGQSLSPNPPPLMPASSGSSWLSHAPASMSRPGSGLGDAAETRFPSLEELDKTFASESTPPPQPVLPPRKESVGEGRPGQVQTSAYGTQGVRSQQTTGIAMRDAGNGRAGRTTPGAMSAAAVAGGRLDNPSSGSRPALTRKHRSSLSIKQNYASAGEGSRMVGSVSSNGVPGSSSSPQKSRDWLTGMDDEEVRTPVSSHMRTATTPSRAYGAGGDYKTSDYKSPAPVMRQSPSKRTSVIEKSALHIPEGVTAQRDHIREQLPPSPSTPSSPTTRAARVFPAIDMSAEPSVAEHGWGSADAGMQKEREVESASSADEGPEDASATPMSKLKLTQEVGRPKRKGRQSSVHDLVDLYGGGGGLALPTKLEKERVSPSLLDDMTPRKATFGSTAPQPPVESKAKRRSTALTSVSTSNPTTFNPGSTLSPPNSGRQPSSGGSPRGNKPTTPTSPRSARPQSMFVFPSKPAETPPPSMLSPPEDSRPRQHTRRTSISDMVQRYEAIGGKPPASPASSSPVLPPVAAPKPPPLAAPRVENGLGLRRCLSPALPEGVHPRASRPLASHEQGPPHREREREPEIAAPRARRTSYKSLDKGGASGPPSRKGTATGTPTAEEPERPYQGVGKLIDQWQRKTAETDGPGRGGGAKRGAGGSGGLVAKRAGLVGKGV